MKNVVMTFFTMVMVMLCFIGCSDYDKPNPINSTYLHPPEVTGIWVTSRDGAVIGAWGSPTGDLLAYPNPFNPKARIDFSIPEAGPVLAWMIRGVGPGEEMDDVVSSTGADLISPRGAPIKILADRIFEAGTSSLDIDAEDLSDGWYRVYISVAEHLQWVDLRLIRNYEAGDPIW